MTSYGHVAYTQSVCPLSECRRWEGEGDIMATQRPVSSTNRPSTVMFRLFQPIRMQCENTSTISSTGVR